MNEDRNRRLVEMMGLPPPGPYDSAWEFTGHCARGYLMDWAVGQEWWEAFVDFAWEKVDFVNSGTTHEAAFTAYLWRNLPALVAEYHGFAQKS